MGFGAGNTFAVVPSESGVLWELFALGLPGTDMLERACRASIVAGVRAPCGVDTGELVALLLSSAARTSSDAAPSSSMSAAVGAACTHLHTLIAAPGAADGLTHSRVQRIAGARRVRLCELRSRTEVTVWA